MRIKVIWKKARAYIITKLGNSVAHALYCYDSNKLCSLHPTILLLHLSKQSACEWDTRYQHELEGNSQLFTEDKIRAAMTGAADVHAVFRDWAVKSGIKIHPEIQARKLPGKGIGIVATTSLAVWFTSQPVMLEPKKWIWHSLQPKTVIMNIPAASLITIDSRFAQNNRIPKGLTVHCTLAAAWTLNSVAGDERQFLEWEATWPSMVDITSSVPLFWCKKLCARMSPAAQGLLPCFTVAGSRKLI